jgi:hypothetical protein
MFDENKECKLVTHLVQDPAHPPRSYLLFGYVGRSSMEGHTRLYPHPSLRSWWEIPDDAILHVEEWPAATHPWGGKTLWVHSEAPVVPGAHAPAGATEGPFQICCLPEPDPPQICCPPGPKPPPPAPCDQPCCEPSPPKAYGHGAPEVCIQPCCAPSWKPAPPCEQPCCEPSPPKGQGHGAHQAPWEGYRGGYGRWNPYGYRW